MGYKLRRKQLAQNFLYNRQLIRRLVRGGLFGADDVVVEIGSGKGLITAELLRHAGRVIAVELDQKLVWHVRRFLGHNPKLTLIQGDFLQWHLPQAEYSVFANVPFNIEGQAVRKLLEGVNPPKEAYLIVMRQLAERLSGLPDPNRFFLTHAPWFAFAITHRFARADFVPAPSVDAVLWRITKREQPWLPVAERGKWARFIARGFRNGLPVAKNLPELVGRVPFSLKQKPGRFTLEQWLALYRDWCRIRA